uniref:Hematopoietic cell signal transducer n=1 Tax=Xiphophorus maculatus TaxID=8083 RepID=M4A7K3_XIPMA
MIQRKSKMGLVLFHLQYNLIEGDFNHPGTIAGVIAADLLLTLIIVVVTYRCASFRRQKIDNADKVYMNVRANVKNIK